MNTSHISIHLAVVLGLLVVSCPAHAAERDADFLPVGLLFSVSGNGGRAWSGGFGFETTWVHYPPSTLGSSSIDAVGGGPSWFGYGLFTQAQVIGTFDHARFALGPQLNYRFFGLEAGAAVETGADSHASTLSAHLAPFISAGFVSVAFRTAIPIAPLTSNGDPYGVELGVVTTFKWPVALQGRTRDVWDAL